MKTTIRSTVAAGAIASAALLGFMATPADADSHGASVRRSPAPAGFAWRVHDDHRSRDYRSGHDRRHYGHDDHRDWDRSDSDSDRGRYRDPYARHDDGYRDRALRNYLYDLYARFGLGRHGYGYGYDRHARGYYCNLCRYRFGRIDSFYDHIHRHHHLSYDRIASHVRWSPLNLLFFFSFD